jgi:hypothetical protein
MVVTGYATDAQGNQWVYVNNPEPQGFGDFECMSYDEWSQDTSNCDPYWAHTHEGDWFDASYSGTQLIYNLATNSVVPVLGLTEAQAPNLAGTVISDRMVPFTLGAVGSGQIHEQVVQETASQTLDFYYRVMNSSGSLENVTLLTIQNFGRATVAVAYRPDSVGTLPALQASRDVTGSNLLIYLEPIPPGVSSHSILLMTDATASNDQGSMGIYTAPLLWFGLPLSTQIATDQPTAVPMTTASGYGTTMCPVMSQLGSGSVNPLNACGSGEGTQQGLPRRLESATTATARKAASEALPRELVKASVGSPIQLAIVSQDQLAKYEKGRSIATLVQPLKGLVIPVHLDGDNYLGVFLRAHDSHFVPVGMGQPNMTRLIVRTREAVAKRYNISPESLTVLKVPALFLTFIARPDGGKIWLTPVSNERTYDLKSGEEVSAEAAFARLQPFALHNHASNLSQGPPGNLVP